MDDRVEKALTHLTSTLNQKDVYSIEISGKADSNGVLNTNMSNRPELKRDVAYKISLVSFSTVSFFPNLTRACNKFYYKKKNDREYTTIRFDTGGYNIKDYNDIVGMNMKANGDDSRCITIFLLPSGKTSITLTDGYSVDFTKEKTWRSVLGFDAVELKTDGIHKSTNVADVVPVQKVYIKCNLCSGSYFNGKDSNILFSFPNNKRYGAPLNFSPNPLIPLKLQTTNLDNIRLSFSDEDGNPVDFSGYNICCQLLIEQF